MRLEDTAGRHVGEYATRHCCALTIIADAAAAADVFADADTPPLSFH